MPTGVTINYRAAATGSGTSYVPLASEVAPTLAEKISGYQSALTLTPQEEAGFGAGGIAVFDRGNQKWRISFSIERMHATPDAALLFLVAHPAAFAALGNLDLQIIFGAATVYFPACAVVEFTPEPFGNIQSTKIRYAFSGGSYTLNAP